MKTMIISLAMLAGLSGSALAAAKDCQVVPADVNICQAGDADISGMPQADLSGKGGDKGGDDHGEGNGK